MSTSACLIEVVYQKKQKKAKKIRGSLVQGFSGGALPEVRWKTWLAKSQSGDQEPMGRLGKGIPPGVRLALAVALGNSRREACRVKRNGLLYRPKGS
jgi:hypothetical protein